MVIVYDWAINYSFLTCSKIQELFLPGCFFILFNFLCVLLAKRMRRETEREGRGKRQKEPKPTKKPKAPKPTKKPKGEKKNKGEKGGKKKGKKNREETTTITTTTTVAPTTTVAIEYDEEFYDPEPDQYWDEG